ncbi:helix-turn-helix domain-containing protein [Nocardia sp. NPDC052566]|uniref:GbsR/MarR family transcriptional regulator n=1 Tax=Nocardia sp. NPDC052566 TaxID=3364330 RepID=UPI0037C58660
MPGRRLAYRDRRQITAGLADSLTYAEIARQLDRPTSTVIREVTRNGGPENYRAEPAQRATEQRARRRKPPVPLAPPAPESAERDTAAVYELAEQLAALLVRMGLPRTASRVFARLSVTDADSLTATELAQALNVSPATISKAVGYLTEIGILLRERAGRRDKYRVGPDAWVRATALSVEIDKLFIDTARRGAATLGAATPAGVRLADMAWSFEAMYRADVQTAERLRDGRSCCPECGARLVAEP